MIFECHQCGKTVERSYMDEYIYRKIIDGKTVFFCGWNCVRQYKKEHEVKKHEK